MEPFDSPVLSGGKHDSHKIQGIGAGIIPDVPNRSVIDEIIQVRTRQAFAVARQPAKSESLLVGIYYGAAVYAATQIALRPVNREQTIVARLPDSDKRYLSTALF